MPSAVQNDWVERVLGVAMPTMSGTGITSAIEAWRTASEVVDTQVSQLQTALRGLDDEELAEIAEFGLNGLTGGHKVPLMAALLGAGKGSTGDRAKLPAIISQFRSHLEDDERVEACDENPFGVAVAIRATLIPALDALTASLGRT